MPTVDSPPILIVADASLLAAQVDGVVVVVDGFNTRSSSLKAALDILGNTQVSIVGVILNKLKRVRFSYSYGYGYPYYYDYYYYKYYRASESDERPVDGAVPVYRRAADRVKSTVSKLRRRGD